MKTSRIFGKDLTEHLDVQPIEGTVTVKDFRVTKYDVDHSAFGACAFLFEVCGKRILYSGDIRLHGKKGILYRYLPQNVDYLFLEGTNLDKDDGLPTEDDVKDKFIQQFQDHPDSAFLVWCPGQNIDRIVALYRACKIKHRALCVDPYTAYVLELAQSVHSTIPTAKSHTNLLIYYPRHLTSRMMDKDPELIFGPYMKKRKLDTKLLKSHPEKFVLLFRPNLLYYVNIYLNEAKVCLTNSIWWQYWEQDNEDILRLKAWLNERPELRKKLDNNHTSGHADEASLQKIVKHIKPRCIIPIHTEKPEKYNTLFPSYTILDAVDETPIDLTDTKG